MSRGSMIMIVGLLPAGRLAAEGNSSLSESNAEAELFRRKYSDLELRMEALGLASANKDRAKLEQRLLAAVSDLQLAKKEHDEYRDQMLRLNEAMLGYLKTSQGGDARAAQRPQDRDTASG